MRLGLRIAAYLSLSSSSSPSDSPDRRWSCGSISRETEQVQQLTSRLRKLKESFREFQNCRQVTGHQVHPLVREEIAKMYDEHGGLPQLMSLTKVGFYTIKKWHSKYKANPLVFREMPLHGCCYRTRKSPDSLKNLTHSSSDVSKYLKQDEMYKEARTIEEMRSLLSADVLEVLELRLLWTRGRVWVRIRSWKLRGW